MAHITHLRMRERGYLSLLSKICPNLVWILIIVSEFPNKFGRRQMMEIQHQNQGMSFYQRMALLGKCMWLRMKGNLLHFHLLQYCDLILKFSILIILVIF